MSEAGELTGDTGKAYAGGDNTGELIRSDELVLGEDGANMVTMSRGQEQANALDAAPGSYRSWTCSTGPSKQHSGGKPPKAVLRTGSPPSRAADQASV